MGNTNTESNTTTNPQPSASQLAFAAFVRKLCAADDDVLDVALAAASTATRRFDYHECDLGYFAPVERQTIVAGFLADVAVLFDAGGEWETLVFELTADSSYGWAVTGDDYESLPGARAHRDDTRRLGALRMFATAAVLNAIPDDDRNALRAVFGENREEEAHLEYGPSLMGGAYLTHEETFGAIADGIDLLISGDPERLASGLRQLFHGRYGAGIAITPNPVEIMLTIAWAARHALPRARAEVGR